MTEGKKTFPIEILTGQEVEKLMRACSRRYPTGIRNRALITLGYRCGLRISEVLSLYPRDVDLEHGVINVRYGKGARQRQVGIDDGAAAILERWLEIRKKLGIRSRAPLFCTVSAGEEMSRGGPLKTSYVRQLMKRLGDKAGIEKRVHFHGLRHAYASELSKEGVAVPEIQQTLGHSNLRTTSVYLDHVSPERVIAVNRNRSGWGEGL